MNNNLPKWALRPAGADDRKRVEKHYAAGTALIDWPENFVLRQWSKARGWPASRFFLRPKFIKKLLESDQSFAFGITGSGVRMWIPVERHSISEKELRDLDSLYESRNEHGHPDGLNALVEGLREVRRAVEAGVEVEVEGRVLKDFNTFYTWAHSRYHMLEDAADKWIGDDS